MPLDSRDYIRGEHPPVCTCVDCVKKRSIHFNASKRFNALQRSVNFSRTPPNQPCPCGAKHVDGKPKKYKHCCGSSKQSGGTRPGEDDLHDSDKCKDIDQSMEEGI